MIYTLVLQAARSVTSSFDSLRMPKVDVVFSPAINVPIRKADEKYQVAAQVSGYYYLSNVSSRGFVTNRSWLTLALLRQIH